MSFMGDRDDALKSILNGQSRIESKVEVVVSLLQECLRNGLSENMSPIVECATPLACTEPSEERGTSRHDSLTAVGMDSVLTDIRAYAIVGSDGARVNELSRAWDRPNDCVINMASEVSQVSCAPANEAADVLERKKSVRKRPSGFAVWPLSVELLSRYVIPSSSPTPDASWTPHLIGNRFVAERRSTTTTQINALGSAFLMISPKSKLFLSWALFAAIVAVLDSSATGLFLVWNVSQRHFVKTGFAVFWTIDVLVNSLQRHRRSGGDILRRSTSCCRYLKTWFALDFSLLCLDWIVIIIGVAQRNANLSGWSIINFLRMYKFALFCEQVKARRFGVGTILILRAVSTLLYSSWFLHVCSCWWLAIGMYSPSDTGKRWTETAGSTLGDFMSAPEFYQYTTSVHWVVSYANMGNIEMYCQNSVERVCSIFFMSFSFVMSSIAVSYLAALLFDLRLASRHKTQQLEQLQRFLLENDVKNGVAMLVMVQAGERLSLRARLAYTDVNCLSLLSSTVIRELKFALVGRFPNKHPLFLLWTRGNIELAKDLSMAIDFFVVAPGTKLFKPLEEGKGMYFLVSGGMVFMQDVSTSLVECNRSVDVDIGMWFCEAAMWTHWLHVGTMEAREVCELSKMHAEETGRLLKQDEIMFRITAAYAEAFHHRIITAYPPRTEWPDDLHVPLTNYADLVMQLPSYILLYIGMEAVDIARNLFRPAKSKKLEVEVKRGKCVLMVNAQGDVERIVSVLVLRLENSSGLVLYQLGKFIRDHIFEAEFLLPGKKRERGEQLSDTIRRSKKLSILCGAADDVREELHETFGYSREYGVRTNYLRAVQIGKLCDDSIIVPFRPDPRLVCADTTMRREAPDLLSCRVCAITNDEEKVVYAWLDEKWAQLLEGKTGESLIKSWMNCFDLVACFSDDRLLGEDV